VLAVTNRIAWASHAAIGIAATVDRRPDGSAR
jgi:hypothetical protein